MHPSDLCPECGKNAVLCGHARVPDPGDLQARLVLLERTLRDIAYGVHVQKGRACDPVTATMAAWGCDAGCPACLARAAVAVVEGSPE